MTAAPVLATARPTLRPHRLDDFPAYAAFFASKLAAVEDPQAERREPGDLAFRHPRGGATA